MNINNDTLCTFFQLSNESIVHLFLKCDKTQQFVRYVKIWLNAYDVHYDINDFCFTWLARGSHTT